MSDYCFVNGGIPAASFSEIVMAMEDHTANGDVYERPDMIVVSIIMDDIERCRYKYLWGIPRRYFDIDPVDNKTLIAKSADPDSLYLDFYRGSQWLSLHSAVVSMVFLQNLRREKQSIDTHPDKLASLLLKRIGQFSANQNIPVLFVIEPVQRLNEPEFMKAGKRKTRKLCCIAKKDGLTTLNLYQEINLMQLKGEPWGHFFFHDRIRSHMTKHGNQWIAGQVVRKAEEILKGTRELAYKRKDEPK